MTCPTWFDSLVAIAPPSTMALIATFVAWVAYQQWKTNKEKLRLDIYNRRFDIYVKTVSFYQALLDFDTYKKAGSFSSLHREFITAKQESKFLFHKNSGIFEILEALHLATLKITGFKEHGKELLASPDVFLNMQQEMQDAYSLFDKSIQNLEMAIAPYLNFHKVLA